MADVRNSPVFVVGAARSGTTLVQCLIAAAQGFYSCPETNFFNELLPRGRVRSGYQLQRPRYATWPSKISPQHLSEAVDKCRRGFLDISAGFEASLRAEAEKGTLSPRRLLELLIREFAPATTAAQGRWVEKTPIHASYLDQIFSVVPEAKVVCVVRSPEAVMESAARTFRVPAPICAIDYWRSYRDVAKYLDRNPDRSRDVLYCSYERLLDDDAELYKLARFLGCEMREPATIRSMAKDLFTSIYAHTFVLHVQNGMGTTSDPQWQRQELGAARRSAIALSGRILRSALKMPGLLPIASSRPTLHDHLNLFVDCLGSIYRLTRWRLSDALVPLFRTEAR